MTKAKSENVEHREPELPLNSGQTNGGSTMSRTQPMPERDIFEEYGESVSSRNIIGQLLKFTKGDWVGGENEEFPIGKHMIVNMDQLLLGWIRWEDQKPADQRMGLLVEGYQAPPRDHLGYGYTPGNPDAEPDTSEWELDDNTHAPRDPWQFTYYLVMKDPDIQEEGEGVYTFSTASVGGRTAIADLCKLYGHKRREHDNYKKAYPVVALKVGSYMHPNKAFGKIKTPALLVIGWASKAVFGELPPPTDATLRLDHVDSDKDIPF